MSKSPFECILIRAQMLSEAYGAHLWKAAYPDTVIYTAKQGTTQITDELRAVIRGKAILIVGGYYRNDMQPFLDAASKITVFVNTSDEKEQAGVTVLAARKAEGFATWSVQELQLDKTMHKDIAKHLDAYLYGWPTDEDEDFQNGIYTLPGKDDAEKVLSLKSEDDLKAVILRGQQKRVSDQGIIDNRVARAAKTTVTYKGKTYDALVVIGDTHIVKTCKALAEKAGIGIALRYDLTSQKTMISMRVREDTGLDAGKIMSQLCGGGGSVAMGGGSVPHLFFPTCSF